MMLQFKCAYRLAASHGHEWAGLGEGPVTRAVIEGGTAASAAEAIARAVASDPDRNIMPGIDRPHVDDDGDIIHTTGTGRLSWTAWSDGQVSLRVDRRAIRFLEALTDPAREGAGSAEEYPGVVEAVREGRYDEGFTVLSLQLCPDGTARVDLLAQRVVDPVHLNTIRNALASLRDSGHPALTAAQEKLEELEGEFARYRRFEVEEERVRRQREMERVHNPGLPRELRERAARTACGLPSAELGPSLWYRHTRSDGERLYGSVLGTAPGHYPAGSLWGDDVVVVTEEEVRSRLPSGWLGSADPLAAWNAAVDQAANATLNPEGGTP